MSNNGKKIGGVIAASLVVAGVVGATGFAETRHSDTSSKRVKPDASTVDSQTAQHNQEQQTKALKDTGVKVEQQQVANTAEQPVQNIGGTTVQQASQNINKLEQVNSMRDAYQRVKQVSMQKAKEHNAIVAQHKANGTQPALITEGATMYSSPREAVVNIHSGWLNVRNESSINGFDLGKTFKGDSLTVLGHDGNWYLVQTQQGVTGFVDGQYVHFVNDGIAKQPTGSVVSPIKGGNTVVTPLGGDTGVKQGHTIDTNHSKVVEPTHHTAPVVKPEKPVVVPNKPVVKPVKPETNPDVKPNKPDVKPDHKTSDTGIALSSQEAQQLVGNEFIALVNSFRQEQGLKPVSINNELQKAATWKANQMAETMILSHKDTKGQYTFNIPGYTNIKAENIAEMGLMNPNPTKAQCKELAKEIFNQWESQIGSKDSLISANDTLMGFAYAVGKNHHDIFFAGEFGDGSSWTNNNKPVVKPTPAKPAVKPVKPVEPTHHTDVKPVVKPEHHTDVKPDHSKDTTPTVKPIVKPAKPDVVKPDHKTPAKPDVIKPDHKTPAKPDVIKPDHKTPAKPDVKPVQPEHHNTKPVVEMGKATFEYQDANGVVGKEITLTGKVGDKIDVTVNVPTGYELVKTLDNGEVANYNDLTFTKAEQHLVVAIVKKEVKPVHHDTKPVVKPVHHDTTPTSKPVVKPVVHNVAPTITGHNVTLKFGEAFNKSELGLSAQDKQDGNITKDITLTGNVNTEKAGVYKVTAKVTDAQGLSAEKTFTITVEAQPVKPIVKPAKPVVKPVIKTGTITVKVINENGTVLGQERTAKGDAGSADTLTMPVAPNGYKIVSITDNGRTIVGMPKTFTDGNQIVEVHVQKLEEPVVVRVMDGNNQLSENKTDMVIGASMGSNLMPTIPNGYHLTGVVTDGTNTGKTVNGVVQEGTNTIIVNVEKDAPKVEGMNAQSTQFRNLVEQDFDTLLAKVRAEHGSTVITKNSSAQEAANWKSNDMMINKVCSHTINGVTTQGHFPNMQLGSEDIAVTSVRSNTGLTVRDAQKLAESIMNMWMSSGTHAASLVENSINNYGFSVSISSEGSVYAAYEGYGVNMSGVNWN